LRMAAGMVRVLGHADNGNIVTRQNARGLQSRHVVHTNHHGWWVGIRVGFLSQEI